MFLDTEIARCPVCKKRLGERKTKEVFVAHCAECAVTFTWAPRAKEPTPLMDTHKPKECNCGHCGR